MNLSMLNALTMCVNLNFYTVLIFQYIYAWNHVTCLIDAFDIMLPIYALCSYWVQKHIGNSDKKSQALRTTLFA